MEDVKKMSMLVKDLNERLVEGWANVEIRDLQGDLIPIDVMKNAMIKYMERGAPINYKHTNHVIGRVLTFWIEKNENGNDGIKILAKVYDDDELMDKAWEEVKKNEIKGFSIGGVSKMREGDKLKEISIHEISLVEKPANPEAKIEGYTFAKGEVNKDCKDKYMADEHNFKEMTCPDKEGEKSKFCACVRFQMSCNGKGLDSAKKICGEIYHEKYGGEIEKDEELKKPFGKWGNFEDCVNYMMEEEGYDEDVARKVCGKINEKMMDKMFIKSLITKFVYENVENTERFKYDEVLGYDVEVDKMTEEKIEKDDVDATEDNQSDNKIDILLQAVSEMNDKLSALVEKINTMISEPIEEKSDDEKEDEEEDKEEEDKEEEKSLKKGDSNFVKVETPMADVDINGVKESPIARLLKGEITVDDALNEIGGR